MDWAGPSVLPQKRQAQITAHFILLSSLFSLLWSLFSLRSYLIPSLFSLAPSLVSILSSLSLVSSTFKTSTLLVSLEPFCCAILPFAPFHPLLLIVRYVASVADRGSHRANRVKMLENAVVAQPAA